MKISADNPSLRFPQATRGKVSGYFLLRSLLCCDAHVCSLQNVFEFVDREFFRVPSEPLKQNKVATAKWSPTTSSKSFVACVLWNQNRFGAFNVFWTLTWTYVVGYKPKKNQEELDEKSVFCLRTSRKVILVSYLRCLRLPPLYLWLKHTNQNFLRKSASPVC